MIRILHSLLFDVACVSGEIADVLFDRALSNCDATTVQTTRRPIGNDQGRRYRLGGSDDPDAIASQRRIPVDVSKSVTRPL